MKFILSISFFCFIKLSFSQINLIPNPSFELYDTCPNILTTNYPNGTLKFWYNPTQSSPDYYNTCAGASGSGVPYNFLGGGGFQYPKNGNGYIGLALYVDPYVNQSEYMQVELIDSLKKDSIYLISFYVNLHNTSKFATKEFNLLFSDTAFFYSTLNHIPILPQMRNIISSCMVDTLNWFKVSNYYIANGGEKFITVGTFVNDSILNLCPSGFGTVIYAYYYFDDFYLGRVSDTTGILEQENKILFTIYPNPVNDILIVESNSPPVNLFLTDVMGRQIMRLSCTNNKSYFNISHLPNGIYFIRKDTFCKKLIVRR